MSVIIESHRVRIRFQSDRTKISDYQIKWSRRRRDVHRINFASTAQVFEILKIWCMKIGLGAGCRQKWIHLLCRPLTLQLFVNYGAFVTNLLECCMQLFCVPHRMLLRHTLFLWCIYLFYLFDQTAWNMLKCYPTKVKYSLLEHILDDRLGNSIGTLLKALLCSFSYQILIA